MEEKFSIPKFSGADFSVWKVQVQTYIMSKDLGDQLVDDPPKAEQKTELQLFNKRDQKVKSILLMALEAKFIKLIMHLPTAKKMWDRLIAVHEQKSEGAKMALQTRFYNARMNANESIGDFISRVEFLASQLADVGAPMPDSSVIGKIISSLGSRYESFVSSWLSTPEDKQTMEVLLQRLLAEEQMRGGSRQANANALNIQAKNRKDKKANKNNVKPGDKPAIPKKKLTKEEAEKLKRETECFKCNKKGHWRSECPQLTDADRQKYAGKSKGDTEACTAEANTCAKHEEWIFDSGASEHMTHDRSMYATYTELPTPKKVYYGDNHFGLGLGVGDIVLTSPTSDLKNVILKDVLHVPGMRRKLFSLSAASERGVVATIEKDEIYVNSSQTGRRLFTAYKKNGLYYADLQENHATANNAETDSLTLWHERYGHINKRAITAMIRHESVDGIDCPLPQPSKHIGAHVDCDTCIKGKLTRRSFPMRRTPRVTEIGHRLHADICGPITPPSLGNSKYFVLYKDEATNYRFVYFVKSKEEVFDTLRKAIIQLQADTNKRVRTFVSDNGSEFTSRRTQEYLLSKEITHSVSAPYTPSQNGFIERDNRTVMEACRCMLYGRKLPEYLWGEAVNSIVYLLNRSINRNSGQSTPFELYFGRKPKVSHLRIFGCLAYIKEQEKKRSGYQRKLEARSYPGIHVGYAEHDFTYRILEPNAKRIVITGNVQFDEKNLFPVGADSSPGYNNLDIFIEELPSQDDDTNEVDGDEGDTNDDDNDETVPAIEQSGIFHDAPSSREDTSSVEDDNEDLLNLSQEPQLQPPIRSSSLQPTQPDVPRHQYNLRSARNNFAEALAAVVGEPTSYEEAMASPQASLWKRAMEEELDSLKRNGTWILTTLPADRKPMSCKWVFKLKHNENGSIARYKARLVARGFTQRYGIDYEETYSPVVKLESIRTILSIAAAEDLELLHFDIRTAFLYGDLDEDIYMSQPQGFATAGNQVCKLLKSLYGLKQASRVWNKTFVQFLKLYNLRPLKMDKCIFVSNAKNIRLIIALYVDDGLVACSNKEAVADIVSYLKTKFETTTVALSNFVGLQISRNRNEKQMFVHQTAYALKLVDRFNLNDANIVSTPYDTNAKLDINGAINSNDNRVVSVPYREAIGALLYLSQGTRPDLQFAVSFLARFSAAPRQAHWNAVKRILRYIKGKPAIGLLYCNTTPINKATAFVDASHGNEDGHSTSGYFIILNNAPIIWRSKKQTVVSISTCQSEIQAASSCARDIIWLRQLMQELRRPFASPIILHMDNQGSIFLANNNQLNDKTKHIQIKYLFIQEAVERKQLQPKYIEGKKNPADLLTKPVAAMNFLQLLPIIGISALAQFANGQIFQEQMNYHLVLQIKNPCDQIFNITYETPSYPYGFYYFKDHVKKECQKQYSAYWNKAIQDLNDCPHRRYKRGVVTSTLLTIFGKAVTNLIESQFSNNQERQLSVGDFYDRFNMNNIFKESAHDYLSICSATAPMHREYSLQQSARFPRLIWSIAKVHGEILANTANLNAISRLCQDGKIATHKLAELMNYPELKSIDPDDTKIIRIEPKSTDEIIFVFDAIGPIDISSMLSYLTWISLVTITLAMAAYAYWLRKRAERQIQPKDIYDTVAKENSS